MPKLASFEFLARSRSLAVECSVGKVLAPLPGLSLMCFLNQSALGLPAGNSMTAKFKFYSYDDSRELTLYAGCGKTELVQEFSNLGFNVLDEAFLDMPLYSNLHPQSVLMETNWICAWFQRILKEASRSDEKRIVIVDRSPLSAVFYTKNQQGKLLLPLIAAQIKELKEVGIEVFTVHVKCETEILWQRVLDRLQDEPERAVYKEDSYEWLLEVKNFYDNFSGWDFTVDNSSNDRKLLKMVMRTIIDSISTKSPKMCDARKMFLESHPPCKRIFLDDSMAVSSQ